MNKRMENNCLNYIFIIFMMCMALFIFRNTITLYLLMIVNMIFYFKLTFYKDSDLKYLRYKDTGDVVSLKSGDDYIYLAYQLRLINKPMLVAVKNNKKCKIDPIEMKCAAGSSAYKKIMTDEEYERIIDWLCQNEKLLDIVYINEIDYKSCTQRFSDLQDDNSSGTCYKINYDTSPSIESVSISNGVITTHFKCGLFKQLSIEDLINYNENYKYLLKDDTLNNFKTYEHCIIWNDDLDIAGSYLWSKGKLINQEDDFT